MPAQGMKSDPGEGVRIFATVDRLLRAADGEADLFVGDAANPNFARRRLFGGS